MRLADLHCDTIRKIHYSREKQHLRQNQFHLDLNRMRENGYCLQNFALFIDLQETDAPFRETLEMMETFHNELEENKDMAVSVQNVQALRQCMDAGRIAGILAVEEGGTLEGKMENLQTFYDRGVRMMNLTWNYENEIGSPNLCWKPDGMPDFRKRNERGLTAFGMDVIAEMERIGMVIDVSHLSDGGFWDVVHNTRKPFAASHSNAAALCAMSRNLTDDMIRAVAGRGGIIGLNFCEDFLQFPGCSSDESMLEAMMHHLKHIIRTGGIECAGLGTDFDGIPGNRDIAGAGEMGKLVSAMERAGLTEDQMEKVCWKNAVRFYGDVLQVPRNL